MSDQFIGEIRLFSFQFAPKGWAQANGQLLSIQQNTALFSLLGTQYGGNGQTTFGLPNLQGRVSLGMDSAGVYPIGQAAGTESVTLVLNQIPIHSHSVNCTSTINNSPGPTSPVGNFWARENNGDAPYGSGGAATTLAPSAIGNAGGSQPHTNLQPYLTVNFCIALLGVFPSRN